MKSDIEGFSIKQLLDEVARRVAAAENRQCWYCGNHARAHTCKHAETPMYHGWTVTAPVPYEGGWKTAARRTTDGAEVAGVGLIRDVADRLCFAAIDRADRPD